MPFIEPSIDDYSHATADITALIADYQATKSAQDRAGTMGFFATEKLTYSDATLGWFMPSHEALDAVFAEHMPNWGNGASYATRVLGNEHGGIVFVTDTPELFGSEIRTISAVNVENGKIVRFVDYWDARAFGMTQAASMRVPDSAFPRTFGEETVSTQAAPELQRIVRSFAASLAGDGDGLHELLHPDVVLEDLTLRTTIHGSRAVSAYIAKAAGVLPYGEGSEIRHIVGGDIGGGYEWTNASHDVPRGITAVAITDHKISRISTIWDGALLDEDQLTSLILKARA